MVDTPIDKLSFLENLNKCPASQPLNLFDFSYEKLRCGWDLNPHGLATAGLREKNFETGALPDYATAA